MHFGSRSLLIVALSLVAGILVETKELSAQCDECPKPTIFAYVSYEDPTTEDPAETKGLASLLEDRTYELFQEGCTDLKTTAHVREIMTRAAEKDLMGPYDREDLERMREGGESPSWDGDEHRDEVDELLDEARSIHGHSDYLLLVTGRSSRIDDLVLLSVSARFYNVRQRKSIADVYEAHRVDLERASAENPDPAEMMVQAVSEVAARFGSLHGLIQRKEIPVTASVEFRPGSVAVGGDEGTLEIRDLRNAEGTLVSDWLGDDTVVAIRPEDTRCRWRFGDERTADGGWFVVRASGGALDGKMKPPEDCQDTDDHPLEAEVEIAPACWRGDPRANGAAFAQGTARARCQLRVSVIPDEDVIEPEESTSGVVYVEDHTGQPLEGDADVALAIDRLRLGTATPGQGTYRHGAPVLFEYSARDDEGTDEIVADVTAQDEWGSRTGDASATVTISEGIAGTYALVTANGQRLPATIYDDPAIDSSEDVISGQMEITAEKMEGMSGSPGMDGRIEFTRYHTAIMEGFPEDLGDEGCFGFYRRVGSTIEIYCADGSDREEWLDTGSFWSSHVDYVATLRGEKITWTEEEPYNVVYVFGRIR